MTASSWNCQPNIYPEKVSEKKPLVGYVLIFLYWGTPYTCMGCFSEVFWEENIFGYCFSETNILWFEYFLCFCKVKRTFGKFQLEAPRAYKCKSYSWPMSLTRMNEKLVCLQRKNPLWRPSWKLLELRSVSRFLAYVTCPHKWRICVPAEKKLCEEK